MWEAVGFRLGVSQEVVGSLQYISFRVWRV